MILAREELLGTGNVPQPASPGGTAEFPLGQHTQFKANSRITSPRFPPARPAGHTPQRRHLPQIGPAVLAPLHRHTRPLDTGGRTVNHTRSRSLSNCPWRLRADILRTLLLFLLSSIRKVHWAILSLPTRELLVRGMPYLDVATPNCTKPYPTARHRTR